MLARVNRENRIACLNKRWNIAYSPAGKEAPQRGVSGLKEARVDCLSVMMAAIGPALEGATGWMGQVFDALIHDLENIAAMKPSRQLLSVLDSAPDQALQANYDILPWQEVISILRRRALPSLPRSKRAEVEALFSQARVVMAEAIQRYHAYRQWQATREAEKLRETNRLLLTTFDIQQLTDVLVERLPELGIPSVYLALDEPGTEVGTAKQARLVLAYTDNERAVLGPGGRLFSSRQLVPPELLPRQRRYSLVAEPLYFQEKPLGYVVFEIGPHDGNVYELLRNNLSSALQGASLFQESRQGRLAAEKADRIKTHLLANVSHEMRTPLNIILGYTQDALRAPNKYSQELPAPLLSDIRQIQSNAEHQLRVINDLLDLSRAEIDELDLSLELLNPNQLLLEAFHSFADQSASPDVRWKLDIPERLPQIRADPIRLRQVFLNLLSNAKKYTERGEITLGAEVAPPQIHFWVMDTGSGIEAEQQERIFEPFVTMEDNRRIAGGIGLGLSITRHLVALHNGTMRLDSQPDVGSTFHIYLPLPALDTKKLASQEDLSPVLLLIAFQTEPSKEIIEMCQRQDLEIYKLCNSEDLEKALSNTKPVAIAWDLSSAQPDDWNIVRRLRHYPDLCQAPFILYGQLAEEQMGLTGFVVKSANTKTLLDAILAMSPAWGTGPVLIVDDDPQVREAHKALVEEGLPGYPIRLSENGEVALTVMEKEVPALVLLDLVMPKVSGADVLDQMRADPNLRQVPVIILSNKMLSLDDVKRIEKHTRVKLQSKGIWSEAETIAVLNRAISGTDALSAHTSGAVKQAIAYIHQNYTRPISRWEIAEAVGVSEDYLSRVFNLELSISPWDYLNRYRVLQSKRLLLQTIDTIGAIARQVGFKDQAYFSRVFRKATGMSPQGFRESGNRLRS